jgi:hypothetical protein
LTGTCDKEEVVCKWHFYQKLAAFLLQGRACWQSCLPIKARSDVTGQGMLS